MKAVVVLSGGQDSALCLALAVKRYGASEVAAISFEYGQLHKLEIKYARKMAKHFKVAEFKLVKLGFYNTITDNALMNWRLPIRKGKVCPNTVVEGRNALFLMLAAIWAKSLGAKDIYTGVSEADYSGYPDCREVFIRSQQRTIRLALDYPINIVTPFMHKTKVYEWALSAKLGIFDLIKNETVTCYNGIPGSGCGKCPSCKLRNRALKEYEASIRG